MRSTTESLRCTTLATGAVRSARPSAVVKRSSACSELLADGVAGAARRKRHARRGVGGDLVEREAQRAVLRFRVRCRRTVERGAAWHVLEPVGQQHEHLGLRERHGMRGDGGGVLEAVGRRRGRRARGVRRRSVRRAARRRSRPCRARRRAGRRTATSRCRRCARACRSAAARSCSGSVIVSSCTTCEPGVTPSKWYLPSSSVTA